MPNAQIIYILIYFYFNFLKNEQNKYRINSLMRAKTKPIRRKITLYDGFKNSGHRKSGCYTSNIFFNSKKDHFDCIDLSDNEIKKLGNFSVL